jgi:hypothetical protein
MAKGNMIKAKKFYCGIGPGADAYEVRRRQFRKEILEELSKAGEKPSLNAPNNIERPS